MLAVELKELKNKWKSKYNKNVEIQHRRLWRLCIYNSWFVLHQSIKLWFKSFSSCRWTCLWSKNKSTKISGL